MTFLQVDHAIAKAKTAANGVSAKHPQDDDLHVLAKAISDLAEGLAWVPSVRGHLPGKEALARGAVDRRRSNDGWWRDRRRRGRHHARR